MEYRTIINCITSNSTIGGVNANVDVSSCDSFNDVHDDVGDGSDCSAVNV